jgi:hypothetical protein
MSANMLSVAVQPADDNMAALEATEPKIGEYRGDAMSECPACADGVNVGSARSDDGHCDATEVMGQSSRR